MRPRPLPWLWAARLALRERRSPSMRLMLLSIIVSVASVTAVGFLGARVEHALLSDARASLAGDRLLLSDRPVPQEWLAAASGLRLSVVLGSQFPTMVSAGRDAMLVSVKTFEAGYPLRGQLQVDTPNGRIEGAQLERGEVYLDPAISGRLGVSVGDSVLLGSRSFRVAGLIAFEPDRGMGFVNLSPRLMMRHEDLASTGLEQPGSRIAYRLWVSSQEETTLARFDSLIAAHLRAGQRFETIEQARPELRDVLGRARSFLSITSMVSLLAACAALGLAARQMARVQERRLALMKALGAGRTDLIRIWICALGGLSLAGALVGLVCGFGVQALLATQIASAVAAPLPTLTTSMLKPLAQGVLIALAMVFVFAWPALLRALSVPALLTLRVGSNPSGSRWTGAVSLTIIVAGLWALMWLGSGDVKLAFAMSAGFSVLGTLFWGLVWLLMRTFAWLLAQLRPRSWGLRSLQRALSRRASSLAAQVIGLGLALAALLLLSFLQTDLVDAWGRSLPDRAPNRFLLNILPGQEDAVRTRISASGVVSPVIQPMVRGRLVAVNDREVGPDRVEDERAKRLLDREMNLSYALSLPAHNKLVQGRALDPSRAEVSVEKGIAQTLGIRLGDLLRFDVAGDLVTARVTSIRSLRWDSMEVNFFMVLSPSLIEDQAKTFITSFYVSPEQAKSLTSDLLRAFPGLTVVELDGLLAQVRRLLDQGILAVQSLFVLGIFGGALVVWAALSASRNDRQREASLLRAFGASRGQLAVAQSAELLFVGGLAGLGAALIAQGVGVVVADLAFALLVPFRWSGLLVGMGLGSVLCWGAGQMALRAVTQATALNALRLEG